MRRPFTKKERERIAKIKSAQKCETLEEIAQLYNVDKSYLERELAEINDDLSESDFLNHKDGKLPSEIKFMLCCAASKTTTLLLTDIVLPELLNGNMALNLDKKYRENSVTENFKEGKTVTELVATRSVSRNQANEILEECGYLETYLDPEGKKQRRITGPGHELAYYEKSPRGFATIKIKPGSKTTMFYNLLEDYDADITEKLFRHPKEFKFTISSLTTLTQFSAIISAKPKTPIRLDRFTEILFEAGILKMKNRETQTACVAEIYKDWFEPSPQAEYVPDFDDLHLVYEEHLRFLAVSYQYARELALLLYNFRPTPKPSDRGVYVPRPRY